MKLNELVKALLEEGEIRVSASTGKPNAIFHARLRGSDAPKITLDGVEYTLNSVDINIIGHGAYDAETRAKMTDKTSAKRAATTLAKVDDADTLRDMQAKIAARLAELGQE